MDKSEWYEELKMDAAEERMNNAIEEAETAKRYNDIEYLLEELDDYVCDANDAIQALAIEINKYGWEMSFKGVKELL